MSIEAETNVNSTVVEVEVTTAPMAVVSVGGSTAAPVSSAPLGDAVVEGPQSVTVVSGPPGPPGPIGSGELEMRVDGAYTLIRQETAMRASADEALASRHTTFETQLGEFRSSLTELETSYSNIDGAFALLKSEVEAARDGEVSLLARITEVNEARVSGDQALATSISEQTVIVGNHTTAIGTLTQSYADLNTAYGLVQTEIEAARAGSGSLLARLTTLDQARVDGDTALASRASSLEAEVDAARNGQSNLAARIAQVDTARVDGDSALATRATSLEAELSGAKAGAPSLAARLSTMDSARITGDEALAGRSDLIEAEIAGARGGSANLNARLGVIDTARVNGDSALATRATNLETEMTNARNGQANLNARLGQIDTARVNGDTALASRATALEAEISGAKAGQASLLARLTQIDQARVDGDTALSSTITTVEAKANSATAGGAVRLVAGAAPSGVSALYEWEIVAGSKKTGMRAGVMSSGAQPGFIEFETEAFRIRNSSGVPTPVFEVTGGQVYINGARLPMVDDLPPPFAGYSRMPYHVAFDDRGRITDAEPAFRLRSFDLADGKGVGAVPYVANTATAPGGGFEIELWDFVASTATGRGLLAAANAGAARSAIGAQAASARLTAIAGAAGMGVGAVPYIADIASPPGGGADVEMWEAAASTSLGRSLLAANDAAAARTLIGAAAIGGGPHTHVIADVTGLQAALDGKLPSASYTAADVRIKLLTVDGAGSGVDADLLDGWHLADIMPVHSARDFPLGTLIRTDIAASGSTPFLVEINGNAYGGEMPFDAALQGYFYQGAIVQAKGYSNGAPITGVSMFAHSGTLCIWFPNYAYWQGFRVFAMVALAGEVRNRVTSITNEAKPTSGVTMEVTPAVLQSWHSGNFDPASKADASHNHSAANITSGTLADARLPAKVTALGAEYPLLQRVDAQGRVTSYRIAVNLQQLEGFGSAAGQVPYVASYDAPNVTWGAIGTGATGRGLMGAATAAAARSTLGAAAASHTHAIADVTALQTALDAKLGLAGGTLTGAVNWSGSGQSTALVRVRRGGNSIEFGHENPAGFGSTIGCDATGGAPFLAFSAEAGTNNATYRTRGKAGSLFRGDLAGGFTWETVSTTTGDNLASTNLASLSAAGTLSVRGDVAALYNLSAGAFSTVGASNGFLAGSSGFYSSRNTTALAYHLSIYNPNGNVGGITTTGTVTTFATSSDHRRKFDVEPLVEFELTPEQFEALPNALLRVMLLQPSSYRRVEEPGGPLHHGFIAHELQAVMPHAVVGDKDAVDADGGEILQLVDHSKLVTDTIAGLQGLTMMMLDHFAMLSADNDDRFAAIENRLDQLEAA